ncbi:hypothetical protein [Sulfolobus acidocaldarius]|uniref:Conserved protein n=4 Tax=Sulfolobus acidocaldarius TaxID=2285 RepID=Q4J8B1_SULAC|nr:hypothetical protein [Sulfolobus acidocaldarius]AAY80970.1 conserved protein [Sulfolobus acidocaldarius DSM 639]AGE71571.1 hypothetical protein SacN8_08055 [Sulfolobus acidocaldarius N8]AGE73844.1 hypothetical protein SacRon12I_08065 [Sulfolobus acidocaldarius Ron12/I]ALU30204.1 hypothetical protein ATY89_09820 [Sulfolobus acidocaldarius]ALU30919.1 hypothetical protein ATZ20_01375 [Sulfolobus acidocaldarius]
MNYGKIAGLIAAVIFIITMFFQIQGSINNGVAQIQEYRSMLSSSSLSYSVKIISYNELNLTVHNPFNLTMIIQNVTGQYMKFEHEVAIMPNTNRTFTIYITNSEGFLHNVENQNENVTIYMRLANTTFTSTVKI